MSVTINYGSKSFVSSGPMKIGAITGTDIDVSSGQYFDFTPTTNTTFSFSNAPASGTAAGFALAVTGANVTAKYDLANASYEGALGDFAYPSTVALSDDGTLLNVIEYYGAVYTYNLSTPFDITTATIKGSNSTLFQSLYPEGGVFIENGSKYISTNFLQEFFTVFNCSTPYDLSTATKGINSSALANTSNATGLAFDDTGTKLFVTTQGPSPDYNNRLQMYTLSTAFDVSTLNNISPAATFDYTAQRDDLYNFFFRPDGKRLYMTSVVGTFEYALSTAWDITTATYTTTHSFTYNENFGYTNSLGSKLYMSDFGASPRSIYQFSIEGAASPATFTYPTSVKWPSGTAPAAPAVGETDVLVFYTDDGGTTYQGFKSSDDIKIVPPNVIGGVSYTTPGTYSWTAPEYVTSVSVVAVGGGGGGGDADNDGKGWGAGGGGLGWKNDISVTPGNSYTVVVGSGGLYGDDGATGGSPGDPGEDGGDSYFIDTSTVAGFGGGGGGYKSNQVVGSGGSFIGDGGGNGGDGGTPTYNNGGGGGGAGGYAGNGGSSSTTDGASGSGGAGGGGASGEHYNNAKGGSGGGVGIYGQGTNGPGGTYSTGFGANGSGGSNGQNGQGATTSSTHGVGGLYGGGGGAAGWYRNADSGAGGAVRIIWGSNRAFPSTDVSLAASQGNETEV